MKNNIVFFIALLLLAVSCNQAEIEQLKNENEALKAQLGQRDGDIANFMQAFNEIEENLAQVRLKEKLIVQNSGSNENGDRVAAVKGDISAIDKLMQENRENLKNLSEKLKSSAGKNAQLDRLVQNLELMVKDKDREILVMVGRLEDLNFEVQDLYSSVSDLKLENLEQDRIIDLQDEMINAAWYIIATGKELIEKNIIDKEGGIIGIGAVKTLSPDIDPTLFTKIDIREKTSFDLDARKVTLVSNHPADSYIIRRSEDSKRYYSFEIVKADDFWKTTKYMVLSIKE